MLINDIITIFKTPELIGYILQGFVNTLVLAAIAAAIGLVLGFIVAIVKIAAEHNKLMRIPAVICNIYTTVFRGTPVALQLFIMVFAVFAIPGFKPYAAILTFGINSGAYVSENIRAGIVSVDAGQMEAGRALGMSWTKTMIKIIMPQAVKNILPALCNEFISTIKGTSLASVFFVGELMTSYKTVQAATFLALQALTIVGIIYFLLNFILSKLLKILERRMMVSD